MSDVEELEDKQVPEASSSAGDRPAASVDSSRPRSAAGPGTLRAVWPVRPVSSAVYQRQGGSSAAGARNTPDDAAYYGHQIRSPRTQYPPSPLNLQRQATGTLENADDDNNNNNADSPASSQTSLPPGDTGAVALATAPADHSLVESSRPVTQLSLDVADGTDFPAQKDAAPESARSSGSCSSIIITTRASVGQDHPPESAGQAAADSPASGTANIPSNPAAPSETPRKANPNVVYDNMDDILSPATPEVVARGSVLPQSPAVAPGLVRVLPSASTLPQSPRPSTGNHSRRSDANAAADRCEVSVDIGDTGAASTAEQGGDSPMPLNSPASSFVSPVAAAPPAGNSSGSRRTKPRLAAIIKSDRAFRQVYVSILRKEQERNAFPSEERKRTVHTRIDDEENPAPVDLETSPRFVEEDEETEQLQTEEEEEKDDPLEGQEREAAVDNSAVYGGNLGAAGTGILLQEQQLHGKKKQKKQQQQREGRAAKPALEISYVDDDLAERQTGGSAAGAAVGAGAGGGGVPRIRSYVRQRRSGEDSKKRKRFVSNVQWKHFKQRLAGFFAHFTPLSNAVIRIEGLFGSGVGSIFSFHQFLIHLNLLVFLIWLGLCIVPFLVFPPSTFSSGTSARSYLGIVGVSGLEDTWFYYGGYTPEQGPYNMAVGYTCAVLLTFIISFLLILARLRGFMSSDGDGRTLVRTDKTYTFASVVMGIWDYKLQAAAAVKMLRKGVVNRLREEMEQLRVKHDLQEKRPWKERAVLYCNRAAGFTIYILLFAVNAGIIVGISLNQNALNSIFPFFVSLIVSILNFVVPFIVERIVKLEEWVSSKVVVRNIIGRVFFIKISNLVIYLFAINELSGIRGTTTQCIETLLGQTFWQLVLVDFGLSAVFAVVGNSLTRACTRRRVEVNFASEVNDLIYRQGIIWIGAPYSPMIMALGCLSNFLLFYVNKSVTTSTCRPPERPWGVSQISSFFMGFLLLTLLIVAVPASWFLNRSSSTYCGPHRTYSTPWSAIPDNASHAPYLVSLGLSWLVSPLVLGSVLLVLVILLYFKQASLKRWRRQFNAAVDELEKERQDKLALLRQFNIRL